jgi:hypothetical protein
MWTLAAIFLRRPGATRRLIGSYKIQHQIINMLGQTVDRTFRFVVSSHFFREIVVGKI